MSSQAIGQRFMVTFSSVAYNGQVYAAPLWVRYTRSCVQCFYGFKVNW